jgi:hypothetical protein
MKYLHVMDIYNSIGVRSACNIHSTSSKIHRYVEGDKKGSVVPTQQLFQKDTKTIARQTTLQLSNTNTNTRPMKVVFFPLIALTAILSHPCHVVAFTTPRIAPSISSR